LNNRIGKAGKVSYAALLMWDLKSGASCFGSRLGAICLSHPTLKLFVALYLVIVIVVATQNINSAHGVPVSELSIASSRANNATWRRVQTNPKAAACRR
jgi:hypothetical protein